MKWTRFERMDTLVDADGNKRDVPADEVVYKNSIYQVNVKRVTSPMAGTSFMWLSIKTLDREARHDWRELQRIKNELCGPECEGVELYPAESRLVDTSNQYHLWVMPPGLKFPFGFTERLVMEAGGTHPLTRNAKQRPWDEDNRPSDFTDPDEAMKGYKP
jgi:hypothetical protein